MNWHRIGSWVFPYIEPLTPAQKNDEAQKLQQDLAAIRAAVWNSNEERALDEAQNVAESDIKVSATNAKSYTADIDSAGRDLESCRRYTGDHYG
ncbi:MAG: hypothetical protein KJ947_07475 [Alphaproteobacteria bacterium]|nr:hypothetical protein [Alphaproteobacteria bacterium]MBU1549402.1 hypothetical protein [Alphaproteobacteria bacterium]MBU2338167.1 hypothetical protein [Alphaproteobacteria bacterium]MBU2387554.1 hypothetical protein [Alphaproteobacteria bacterium]